MNPEPSLAAVDLLRRTRLVVAVLVASAVGIAAVGVAVVASGDVSAEGWGRLVLAAGLVGLIAPVMGHRAYERMRSGVRRLPDNGPRHTGFQRATIVAVAITYAAALGGIVIYMRSGEWMALSGVATHVLLGAAIWPSRTRLESFLEPDRVETDS